jgi:archaellum component FlaC
MAEIFKTTKLTYEELQRAYERIGADYQKETQENTQLKSDLKHFRDECERLEKRVRELKKEAEKANRLQHTSQ